MATSLPKFSRAAQKILVAQNLGGGCSPPHPPGPYAYGDRSGEGGGVNVGHSLSPPSHFMLATGLSDLSVVSLSY